MKRMRTCGLLLIVLALAGPAGAVTVIDFEDWTGGPDIQYSVQFGPYTVAGSPFTIAPHSGTDNSTLALHTLYSGGLKILSYDGPAFDVKSIDLNEGLGINKPLSIKLYGSGPGIDVEETFILDGDPLTYQTFEPTGFSSIHSPYFYSLEGEGLSIDNIVLPEPSCLSLLLMCGLAVWWPRNDRSSWPNERGIGLC